MKTIADNPCLSRIIADYYNYSCDEDGVWIGNKYVSMPFFSYGSEKAKAKIKAFKKWEYRGFEPVSEFYTSDKTTSFLYLLPAKDEQFNSFKSNLKRKIRKANKNELITKNGRVELLEDFYNVYSMNMKYLGSPSLPKSFFSSLLSEYENGDAKIFIVYYKNKAVASSFLLSYQDFAENTWFASNRKFNHLYISYLLHWEMIKFSISKQLKIYSFGRSTTDGSVHYFKKQWGTKDIKLFWSYSEKQKLNIRKLKILAVIWKKIPFFITKRIESLIAKKIY